MTNTDIIRNIIAQNKGYITKQDIDKANIPSAQFYRYVRSHGLNKLCAGFYAEKDWFVDDYLVFQYSYPKLIYSFYSAAYLHGLGDYLPPFLEVTGPKNYRPFPLPKDGIILHTDTRESIYSLGITQIDTNCGNKVFVYDIEKTVLDFIRNRNKIDSESFVKCVNIYRRRKDKNIMNLMKYAKIMKIEEKVSSIMEIVLNDDK